MCINYSKLYACDHVKPMYWVCDQVQRSRIYSLFRCSRRKPPVIYGKLSEDCLECVDHHKNLGLTAGSTLPRRPMPSGHFEMPEVANKFSPETQELINAVLLVHGDCDADAGGDMKSAEETTVLPQRKSLRRSGRSADLSAEFKADALRGSSRGATGAPPDETLRGCINGDEKTSGSPTGKQQPSSYKNTSNLGVPPLACTQQPTRKPVPNGVPQMAVKVLGEPTLSQTSNMTPRADFKPFRAYNPTAVPEPTALPLQKGSQNNASADTKPLPISSRKGPKKMRIRAKPLHKMETIPEEDTLVPNNVQAVSAASAAKHAEFPKRQFSALRPDDPRLCIS